MSTFTQTADKALLDSLTQKQSSIYRRLLAAKQSKQATQQAINAYQEDCKHFDIPVDESTLQEMKQELRENKNQIKELENQLCND